MLEALTEPSLNVAELCVTRSSLCERQYSSIASQIAAIFIRGYIFSVYRSPYHRSPRCGITRALYRFLLLGFDVVLGVMDTSECNRDVRDSGILG